MKTRPDMPTIQFIVVGTLAVLVLTLVILAVEAIKRRGRDNSRG